MARIVQFFGNVDMRKGIDALSQIPGVQRELLRDGEVYVFRNRDWKLLSVLTRDTLSRRERLKGKETWDWKTRKEQILKLILKTLGVSLTADDKVYAAAQKDGE